MANLRITCSNLACARPEDITRRRASCKELESGFVNADIVWPRPHFDNRALLAQSKIPVLFLCGDLDVVVPPAHSRLLLNSAASSDKQLVTLPSCGHNDVGLNDPELFEKTIADFVARHGSKPQAR